MVVPVRERVEEVVLKGTTANTGKGRWQAATAALMTDGYCVLRDFLPADDVRTVVDDYRARGASGNANYQIGLVSGGAVDVVRNRIAEFAEHVAAETTVATSFEGMHQGYYFDTQVLTFNSWHQDAESHYMLGSHADYLNFYIPIVKEVRERTNVQVVPASRLRERAPAAWAAIENGGGTICHVNEAGTATTVVDESGVRSVLPFDIGEIGETPELGVGDLLLMRGDTFHRTQDADTKRVALSLRLANPDRSISLKDLSRGSSKKVNLMAGNWDEFGPAFDFLDRANGGEAPWREVRMAIERSADEDRPHVSRNAARLRILKEKLRQGTVLESVGRELSFRKARRQLAS